MLFYILVIDDDNDAIIAEKETSCQFELNFVSMCAKGVGQGTLLHQRVVYLTFLKPTKLPKKLPSEQLKMRKPKRDL